MVPVMSFLVVFESFPPVAALDCSRWTRELWLFRHDYLQRRSPSFIGTGIVISDLLFSDVNPSTSSDVKPSSSQAADVCGLCSNLKRLCKLPS